jgi:hypothetical protein
LGLKDLAINGADVMRVLGTGPGRHVGQILERLLDRVLDDPSLNQKQTLEHLTAELVREI